MRKTGRKTPAQTRSYRSPLRQQRANQTRDDILDALVRVMARDGIADISIPLIAKEANVSVPSVYRHFPTKKRLIEALDDYSHRKGSFGLEEIGAVTTPEELAKVIPEIFRRRAAIAPTLSAAMNSRLGYQIRRPEFQQRAQFIAEALRPVTRNMTPKESAWLNDVVFVLNSFSTVRAFRDYLGLDTGEAAERVSWAIQKLANAARKDGKNQ